MGKREYLYPHGYLTYPRGYTPGWHDTAAEERTGAMKFIQYYLDCLSHASYLIGDETTGRAVVVDPQRDVAEYLADAKERA